MVKMVDDNPWSRPWRAFLKQLWMAFWAWPGTDPVAEAGMVMHLLHVWKRANFQLAGRKRDWSCSAKATINQRVLHLHIARWWCSMKQSRCWSISQLCGLRRISPQKMGFWSFNMDFEWAGRPMMRCCKGGHQHCTQQGWIMRGGPFRR